MTARKWLLAFMGLWFLYDLSILALAFGVGNLTVRWYFFYAACILGLPVLAMAAWKYSRETPLPYTPGLYSGHLWALGTLLVLLAVYGLFRGNHQGLLFRDFYAYSTIFMFFILGRYDQAWKDIEKPLILLFWISVVLMAVGLTRAGTHEWEQATGAFSFGGGATGGDKRAWNTAAYDMRPLMQSWALVFAMSFFREKKDIWKILGLCAPIANLLFQIFAFRFRSEVAMVCLQIGIVIVVVPFFQRKLKLGTAFLMVLLLGGLFLASRGTEGFQILKERVEGETDLWGGRLAEFRAFKDDQGPVEWFIGKGMGGGYVAPVGWSAGTHWQGDTLLRDSFHIGFFEPLLKGGVAFVGLYFLFFLRMLRPKPPGWYTNRFNVVAISIVPMFLLSQVIVPPPSAVEFLLLAAAGMSAARMGTGTPQPEYEPEALEYMAYEPVPAQGYYQPRQEGA